MCLYPTRAAQEILEVSPKQLEEGANPLSRMKFGRPKPNPNGDLLLPCGKCHECLTKRATEWAMRCKHELSLHNQNSFITLTYDSTNLVSQLVVKENFQKFMKRLRKHTKSNLRYIVSHEYGSKTLRPHHHAIIFGYDFKNQTKISNNNGNPLFTSPELDNLWPNGFHSIGEANVKTAYYIASYALKGKKHDLTIESTGERISVNDSMDCSRRPAIGLNYLKANYKQIFLNNDLIPRYYIKKLETIDPEFYEQMQNKILDLNRTGLDRWASHELHYNKLLKNPDGHLRSAPVKDHDYLYNQSYLRSNL